MAVLIDYVDYLLGGYATQVRCGLEEAAQRHGLWLNVFVGHELGCGPEASVHWLAGKENADGLIVLTAGLAAKLGLDAVGEFLARHRDLPVCSLGVTLPGIVSVVADNQPGLREVIDHVIVTHGRRKLVCLAGLLDNPDANARFNVYLAALAHHGIAFDPSRVKVDVGNILSARHAVQQLIDDGIQFDAIIAVSDIVALGALDALSSAGIQVPLQVALTGFDDLPICRFTQPPLTTVRQPTRAMAARAIELVVAQMSGHGVPLVTSLAVQAVRRASCGCLPILTAVTSHVSADNRQDLSRWLEDNEDRLVKLICAKLEPGEDRGSAFVLLARLKHEIAGHRGVFITELEERMRRTTDLEREYEILQSIIALLREALSAIAPDLGTLWSEAERTLAVATMVDQARQRVAIDVAYHGLLASGASLARAFDWDSLKHHLAEALPALAESAYISLKVDDSLEWLEPFFCMSDGIVQNPVQARFPASQLIPPSADFTPHQRSRLVLPLTDKQAYLGIAVIELRPGLGIHEMLSSQIGTALTSVSLHQQIVQQTALNERSLQERLATAKRLQSLSVLAGGVAHDLNNALGPLVALPHLVLDQLKDVPLGSGETHIKADLELMQGAALRAAQTIKDLLTLGRQGRMPKEPLELNRFTKNAVESDQLLRDLALRRGVTLKILQSPERLVISASEPQLQRALSNLLRNALDVTEPGGEIRLKTYPRVLTEPLEAYETIEPGNYAVIEVSDMGNGILPADLGRVFEPFFSNKQLTENSGTGLGLAIVHGVVKEHQGFASVESTLGQGTTFLLYFPRTTQSIRPARSVPPIRTGVGRILVVDDDPVQMRTAKRVLDHHGYEVTTASSSAEAYRIHDAATVGADRTTGFDLVIVDMILNEAEDGLSLFARLQRLNATNRGLVVSGNAPTERLNVAVNKGLRFLAKPYRVQELLEAVQMALDAPVPQPITIAPGAPPQPSSPSSAPFECPQSR